MGGGHFFFSSRRRHTRCSRDWSSDVCSSDLTESLVLALGGGTFGLFLAALGIRILKLMNPGTIPRLDEVSIDSSVLAFTLGISCLAGFASGLAPALKLARADVQQTLKEAGRSSIGSAGRR